MTAARNDRNTVQFGPSRTPQSYQLDRLEEQVKDVERATTEQFTTVNETIVNITGNAELLVGTVVTYSTATNSGTVDIDGAVVAFANASSVRLEADDVIILSANDSYPDPFAVGLYNRNGGPVGYDTYEFVVPSGVPGLPRDVSPMGVGASSSRLTAPLIVNGNTAYSGTQATSSFVGEDWDTPVRTSISLPVPPFSQYVGGSLTSFCRNGTILVATTSDNNTTSSLCVNDGAVWTTYDYAYGNVARYADGGAVYGAFGRKKIAGVWTSGTWLVEVSGTGVVSETDLSASMGNLGAYGWCDADNGHIVIADSSGDQLYVDGTVHSYTFDGIGKLPYDIYQFKGGATTACIYGDDLYFLFSAGASPGRFDPAGNPIGLGVMDLTSPTLATTSYSNIITSTGNREDGEPIYPVSITVVNGTHVAIGGGLSYSYDDPVNYASFKETRRPCVWLYNLSTNTVTSYVSADTRISNYAGFRGQTANGTYVEFGQLTVGCEPGTTKLIMLLDVAYRVIISGSTIYTDVQFLEGLDVV
jgi:hypothetical protein